MHSFWRKLGVGTGEGVKTWAHLGVPVAKFGEVRLQRASAFCSTSLRAPGRGPTRAKGAQAEPEQSPAGRQWEGPGQPGGNSQAWGRQAGAWLGSPGLQGCPEPSASTSPHVESGQIFCPSRWGKRKFYLLSHLNSTCFARPHSPTLPSPWASGFQSNLIIALFCSHTFFHGSPLLSLQNF